MCPSNYVLFAKIYNKVLTNTNIKIMNCFLLVPYGKISLFASFLNSWAITIKLSQKCGQRIFLVPIFIHNEFWSIIGNMIDHMPIFCTSTLLVFNYKSMPVNLLIYGQSCAVPNQCYLDGMVIQCLSRRLKDIMGSQTVRERTVTLNIWLNHLTSRG